jgi:putative transposase
MGKIRKRPRTGSFSLHGQRAGFTLLGGSLDYDIPIFKETQMEEHISSGIDIKAEAKKYKSMKDLMAPDGLIKQLMKAAVEGMLEGEIEEHLGYAKYAGKGHGNTRNGKTTKTVRTGVGDIDLAIPRDRTGDFEPQIVKKHQRDISDFDEQIISMYARGMTTRDIQTHVRELYGADISPTLVSNITDKVMGVATEWQNRPLESIYVAVFFDAIHYKVRENGRVVCKASYTSMGITLDGKRDILGIWIGEHEGARFWLSVFTELQQRGVRDIFITCIDGLKGVPAAVRSIFPRTEVQLCIVHMIRNSMKHVASSRIKEFVYDLKFLYQAISEKEALVARKQLEDKWFDKYPLAVQPWITHWDDLSGFFKYPEALRKIIYTTNAIENLHRRFRKVTKNRAVFANDDALFKMLFLAARDVLKKCEMVRDWPTIKNQIYQHFGERLQVIS